MKFQNLKLDKEERRRSDMKNDYPIKGFCSGRFMKKLTCKQKTRPDKWLTESRADDRQGKLRNELIKHLGRGIGTKKKRKKKKTGRPRAIYGKRYPLPCFA